MIFIRPNYLDQTRESVVASYSNYHNHSRVLIILGSIIGLTGLAILISLSIAYYVIGNVLLQGMYSALLIPLGCVLGLCGASLCRCGCLAQAYQEQQMEANAIPMDQQPQIVPVPGGYFIPSEHYKPDGNMFTTFNLDPPPSYTQCVGIVPPLATITTTTST